jgi:16S rRNA (cytosine967-C5)-methyltransferase
MAELHPAQSGPPAHKLRHFHWRAATHVLARVLAGEPADGALRAQFRDAPQSGARDRASIASLVYGVLRDQRALQALAGDSADALCAAQLLLGDAIDVAALAAFGFADAAALAARVRSFDRHALTAAQQLNVPDEAFALWRAQFGDEEARSLAIALNREASVDLRVNALRSTRAATRAALADEGIDAAETSLSPWGLRLAKRGALQSTRAWREGWIEPQDEGSQLLALVTQAAPGETIADFCAGAGGKTLALAAMMESSGRLIALDIDAARLARLSPRLQRAGVSGVEAMALDADGAAPAALHGTCDAVLVDAPCSASGTWRRNPELRLRPLDLEHREALQRRILEQASALVRPGGRLVYATCSLFREENQDVVESFMAAHGEFGREDIVLDGIASAPYLQLLPQRHATDGFFAARLRRCV